MNQKVRPARPVAPILASVTFVALWWLIAHNSGAGWMQAIGDVIFGTLVVGILGPSIVLARAKVELLSAPTDSTTGHPVEVRVKSSVRLRLRSISPNGPEAFVGPVRKKEPADPHFTLVPQHRGVYESLTVEIATAAPFALQWWTRRVVLVLPSPLHVAPSLGPPMPLTHWRQEDSGESVQQRRTGVGEPKGARPYAIGDHQRHIHWRATAHAGELMMREQDGWMAEPVKMTVTLPRDEEEAERLAERALGSIVTCLNRGTPVLLSTVEVSGPVVAIVRERYTAGRRLSRATASVDRRAEPAGVTASQ